MPRRSAIPPLAPDIFTRSNPQVVQINVSAGGVPKLPIGRVMVDERGIVGDKHADRRYHGAPHQALSLYALELILALQAEGHPIEAGAAGENITTRGLDWAKLVPGRRLRLGSVLAELSEWATPCGTIAHCFSDGQSKRISDKLHPGWSRAYAAVVEGGVIAPGDGITILP